MNIAIIPARKGSKRLKNKNLLKIQGKTLIDITLDTALKIKSFDKIIFTSDIEIVLRKYEKLNKNIILNKRPKKLCKDNTSTDSVIGYLIKKYKMNKEDTLILLQVTSPLRKTKHIKNAMRLFQKNKKPVYSVYKLNIKDKAYIQNKSLKKLDLDNIMILNGAIYIFSVKQFLENNRIPDDFVPFIMKFNESIDIDSIYDYDFAKYMYNKMS